MNRGATPGGDIADSQITHYAYLPQRENPLLVFHARVARDMRTTHRVETRRMLHTKLTSIAPMAQEPHALVRPVLATALESLARA